MRFLDTVLGLAALAIQIVVEYPWFTCEAGHHVARIVALFAVLQPCDHPAFFAPTLCGIDKLTDLALLASGGDKLLPHGQFQEFGDAL